MPPNVHAHMMHPHPHHIPHDKLNVDQMYYPDKNHNHSHN